MVTTRIAPTFAGGGYYGLENERPSTRTYKRAGRGGYYVDDAPPLSQQFAPIGKGGGLPTMAGLGATKPQEVNVGIHFDQVPPIKVEMTVNAGSQLLSIADGAKTATAKLAVQADTGPGGLGETHTGQH